MKNNREYKDSVINIDDIILAAIEKHKLLRSDIEYVINLNNEQHVNEFRGTKEMWASIVDNVLGNFIRYADKKIQIIVDNKTIIFENDGEKIKEDMIEKIFLPYVKGNKGQSGLGLSIVKITAKNIDKGVRFIIN